MVVTDLKTFYDLLTNSAYSDPAVCMHMVIRICTDQKCINPFPLTTNLQQTTLKTTEQKYKKPIYIEFKLLNRSENFVKTNNIGSDQTHCSPARSHQGLHNLTEASNTACICYMCTA